MATTPFKIIQWSPSEIISDSRMDNINSNLSWLYENTPLGIYTLPGGARKTTGIRIACGRVTIPPTKSDNASASVRFGNFFSSGCQPIITTGIVSDFQRRLFAAINGFGDLNPDHTGFQVYVNVAAGKEENDYISSRFYVTWQAMGY
jgi:hypothetical protein